MLVPLTSFHHIACGVLSLITDWSFSTGLLKCLLRFISPPMWRLYPSTFFSHYPFAFYWPILFVILTNSDHNQDLQIDWDCMWVTAMTEHLNQQCSCYTSTHFAHLNSRKRMKVITAPDHHSINAVSCRIIFSSSQVDGCTYDSNHQSRSPF